MACVPGLGGDTSEDEQASSRAPDGKRICQRARLKSPTVAEALDDLLLTYTTDLSVFAELKHPELEAHIQRVGVVFFERDDRVFWLHPHDRGGASVKQKVWIVVSIFLEASQREQTFNQWSQLLETACSSLELFVDRPRGLWEFLYLYKFQMKPP